MRFIVLILSVVQRQRCPRTLYDLQNYFGKKNLSHKLERITRGQR